jgi:signal transduction histidine kinase/CheY-like chemotaxis protein/HPt (histidine-containing phosphotransfer) domain-containing protein/HAMP domain-containing protein
VRLSIEPHPVGTIVERWSFSRQSLRVKVLTLALALVFVINMISSVVSTALTIWAKHDELQKGAEMLSAIQAQGMASPVRDFNHVALQGMLQGLTLHPDFANAMVMDNLGNVLASVAVPDNLAGGTLSGDTAILWRLGDRQDVMGSVQIHLTTKSLWQYGRRQAFDTLVMLVVNCVAVGAAIIFAFRLMGRPLTRVAAAAQAIGQGDHAHVVPEQDRGDEVGAIARAVEQSRRQMVTIEALRHDMDHMLRLLFVNAADGILVADSDGVVETANPGASTIFRRSEAELTGQKLAAVLPVPPGRSEGEIDARRADGAPLTLAVSRSDFVIGAKAKSLVILHDITERKQIEQALIDARQAAEDANLTKSAFLANMSHEIRTPMNAVIGLTRLVLGSELNDIQRHHLDRVLTSANGLLSIINDILDLSKIEAGKLNIETVPFFLDDLFDELADLHALRAREKGLELVFDLAPGLPGSLLGDPVRLRQILVNLISNAVKFTDAGEVVLSVIEDRRQDDRAWLSFSVRDTGIGMSPEQCEHVFDAFAQADNTTSRRFGGTGLGLTISRNLAEMMGGSISVRSGLGQGSLFTVSLPFRVDESAQSDCDGEEPHALARGSWILAVDGNDTARSVLKHILDSLHCQVVAAATQAEALALIDSGPFVAAVIAHPLPDSTGTAAIQRLKRRNPELRTILTAGAEADQSGILDARHDGVDCVLLKPLTPSRLMDSLVTALNPGRQRVKSRDRAPIAQPPVNLSGRRILLVEDNDINRELAMAVLARTHAHVDTATNGAEAVAMVKRQRYDGVLMDCQMPILDGYGATRQTRAMTHLRTLPIIATTANAMSGDREKCLDAGMDDYITKPFEEHELMAVLRRWMPAAEHHHTPPDAPPDAQDQAAKADTGLHRLSQVDVELGLRQTGNNQDLYLRVLRRFAGDYRDFDKAVSIALAEGDLDTAIRLAHTLKGLAGTIGARDLKGHAGQLENVLRNDPRTEAINRMVPAVLANLTRVTCDIDSCLNAPAPVEFQPTSSDSVPPDMKVALSQLRQALAAGDVDSRDRLEHVIHHWPDLSATLAQVCELVDQYRYDEAQQALDIMDVSDRAS